MRNSSLDASLYLKAMMGVKVSLELNCDIIDNLNVYPVPDGDTGVNMLYTVKPAVEHAEKRQFGELSELAKDLLKLMTNNSRGNSGFIVSRFFSGFSEGFLDADVITVDLITKGFKQGHYQVLASLLNPVAGTMMTIIEVMADTMELSNAETIEDLLEEAIVAGRVALFKTPEQLPILAKAGVVDSGALGFIKMIEGFLCGLTGEKVSHEKEDDYRFEPDNSIDVSLNQAVQYRYCTEVLVENPVKIPGDEMINYLKEMGDSIAYSTDGVVKVHIHTNEPEVIVSKMAEYGVVSKKKIEDMQDQVTQVLDKINSEKDVAVLAVIPGIGFEPIFRDFGAEEFLIYKDNLPSAGEILETISRSKKSAVILLPNDKNIIPAAKMAEEQSDKSVVVIPTNNVVEGIVSMYNFSEGDSASENFQNMSDNLDIATCYKFYQSVRDAKFGDIEIINGKFFGVKGDVILSTSDTGEGAIIEAFEKMDIADAGLISFYYNDKFDDGWFPQIKEALLTINPDIEIEKYNTGQKKEIVIVSTE